MLKLPAWSTQIQALVVILAMWGCTVAAGYDSSLFYDKKIYAIKNWLIIGMI